jgi:hypothetical protein
MWTVPRVLVRRTASPAHTDFGGLSSLAALVVVRLDVVPLPPSTPRRRWRVVGWADILLDVISGVESALREGCPGVIHSARSCCIYSTMVKDRALTKIKKWVRFSHPGIVPCTRLHTSVPRPGVIREPTELIFVRARSFTIVL